MADARDGSLPTYSPHFRHVSNPPDAMLAPKPEVSGNIHPDQSLCLPSSTPQCGEIATIL